MRTRAIVSTVAVAAVLAAAGAASAQAQARPNILWLSSEDNGPALGAYGDAYADTPNLDRLADRGTVYLNAWSNAPVCAPARTAIITGMYPPGRRGAPHAQPGSPAGRGADVPAAPARGGVLRDEQRERGLQRREAGPGVGRVVERGALAQPSGARAAGGGAVLRGVQPRRHPREPHPPAAPRGGARPRRGTRPRLSPGHPGGAARLGAVLRPADGDGRAGGRPAGRARGGGAGR